MQIRDVGDAAARFSCRLAEAWEQAGRPSADELALRAQEKLDVDVSPSTIRGWLRHGRLPRSDEAFLAVLRLLRVERPQELMSLLRAARQLEAEQRGPERPAVRQPAASPVPRQLPAVLGDFIGRQEALAALGEGVRRVDGGSRQMAVFSIVGAGGVGKTSLALWWAHENLGAFPDGQLYVDLRGFGPSETPMSPSAVIGGFLTALATPASEIPTGIDDQTALYRSLLSGRRMLVVLDNARDVEQVLPLLPGSPSCVVLVTSRARLTGLQVRGAHLVELNTLPDEDAHALLLARLGSEAASTQADAVAALVRFCAGLPLALAVVAARATAQRALPLAALVEELAAETHRLDALDAGDVGSSARAVFSWSYRALPPEAARAFRLLALATGPDIGLDAGAALLGTEPGPARTLLDTLVAAHLLQEHRRNRYRMHDLLRIFSGECLDEEPTAARRQAVLRLVDWFVRNAESASQVLAPHRRPVLQPAAADSAFQTYDAALEWYSVEHGNAAAAIELAAVWRVYDLAWKLTIIMFAYYNLNKGWREYLGSLGTALEATRRSGDDFGTAWVLNATGATYGSIARYQEATSHLEQSLVLWRRVGDQRGISMALNNLGESYRRAGFLERAIELFEMDYRLCRDLDDEDGQSISLNNLGKVWLTRGDTAEAIRCHGLALEIRRRVVDLREEAEILNDLGEAYRRCQQYPLARQSYHQAWEAYQRVGDSVGAVHATISLAELAHERGELHEARRWAGTALSISATVNEGDAPSLRRQVDALQRRIESVNSLRQTC